jgi:hypothetical protein
MRARKVLRVCFGVMSLVLNACIPAGLPAPTTAPAESLVVPVSQSHPAPATHQAPEATLTSDAGELRRTAMATVVSTAVATPTPDMRSLPREWASWPVVPTVSAKAREVYREGILRGNKPNVFSTIGDCQSEPPVFLGIYATDRYHLDQDYQHLQQTIDYFHDSFSHPSQAVKNGLSAPSALSPLWADRRVCLDNESPAVCELRLRRPSIVFINLGTNWKPGASAERYAGYLRQIVELVIANGSLPILSTKADNVEGDHSINRATAQVAYDYDIPLWNFWRAADDLPNHGLDADRENVYLTPAGWDRRNFTALLVLDAVWQAVREEEPFLLLED